MLLSLSLIVLHVLIGTLCVVAKTNETPPPSYFLPKTSIPNHYDLNINIFLEDVYKYNGSVGIDITVLEKTDILVLHSDDVEVDYSKSFVYSNSGKIPILSGSVNRENNFLTLKLEKHIEPGSYGILFTFEGLYYTNNKALFLSSYDLPNGDKKYLVATHFEPNTARNVFPCYDEPNLKATFRLKITHPINYNAISNSPIESIRTIGKTTTTTFMKTAKMSTYLLALAVSDFETLEKSYNGKPVRLYVKPGQATKTEFSLDISLKALYNLEKLLNVNYSLPKLDGIAIPTYGGGMENWGLIVYGNSVIVKNSSASNSGSVNLLCHEIAHQWFGNLVTLDWWDYLWLNEGFATYYAQRISDMIMPAERFMYSYYVSKILTLRYNEGGSSATDSINRHVEKPTELRSKFNSISYDKGSIIVRFMSMIFPNFDTAITKYLKENSFKNTIPADLFRAVEDHSLLLPTGSSVAKIMNSWITNPGYPLLTINITQSNGLKMIQVKQERFTLDGKSLPNEKWWIPITVTIEDKPNFERIEPKAWLGDRNETILLNVQDNTNGWLIANLQQVVHCRINYDLENWQKIISYLKGKSFEQIHVLNRIQLIDDSNNLAKSRRLPENVALDLLKYLKQEKDELVLKAARYVFRSYAELLRNTPAFEKYKTFAYDIFAHKASDILQEDQGTSENLIDEAVNNISNLSRDNEALHNITEGIYTKEKHVQIQQIVRRESKLKTKTKNLHYNQLLEEINQRAATNIAVKENFLAYNYPEVIGWLNSNY